MSLETQFEIRKNAQALKSGLSDLHGWLRDVNDQGKTVNREGVISRVSRMKERGNDLFKRGNFPEAKTVYSNAIDTLSSIPVSMVKVLRSQILLNRALCSIRVEESNEAVIDCTESFKLVPTAKALYRRSCAELKLKRTEAARNDVLRALKMIPDSDVAAKEECEEQLKAVTTVQTYEAEERMKARRRRLCSTVPQWCRDEPRAPLVELAISGLPNSQPPKALNPPILTLPVGTRYIPRSERMFQK